MASLTYAAISNAGRGCLEALARCGSEGTGFEATKRLASTYKEVLGLSECDSAKASQVPESFDEMFLNMLDDMQKKGVSFVDSPFLGGSKVEVAQVLKRAASNRNRNNNNNNNNNRNRNNNNRNRNKNNNNNRNRNNSCNNNCNSNNCNNCNDDDCCN